MMAIELPKLNQSQQDMDMIDILWKQDIDLGAGREVFDFSYRQKEHELQKQRELEEEKRQQMQREQEKALLAQLQLDEETGEFVPRSVPSGQPQPATDTPSEVIQNAGFPVDGDAMSFDECMELLAQTFPLVEPSETASTCLGTSTPPTATSQLIMAAEQPPLAQTPLPAAQKTWSDLDQAWIELLSIPELEQCLNIQIQELTESNDYLSTNSAPEVQDPSFGLFMPSLTDVVVTQPEVCPPEFMGSFEVSFPGAGPANLLSQMSLKAPDTVVSGDTTEFCEMFYPDLLSTAKVAPSDTPQPCNAVSKVCQVAEPPNSSPLKPLDMRELSAGDPFKISKGEMAVEFPDSDSGLSLDASPNISSPEKSTFGDGSLGFSDSDMDDMDSGPGSESDYSEMFSLPFTTGSPSGTTSDTPTRQRQDRNAKHAKTEPSEAHVHSKPPFTKDKAKRRSEARLSRDEQRAKALQIPFTVDMIINLPVDDFNELMSKHQLNESQLALVRDIRRRGKNKVAAQNCRKRKMENIVGLECDLDSLKEERERLLREKTEQSSSLRQMKQQLNSLYLEVFSMLRDEQGRPYSPADYSLQQTSDGNVFLVPRVKKTLIKSDG